LILALISETETSDKVRGELALHAIDCYAGFLREDRPRVRDVLRNNLNKLIGVHQVADFLARADRVLGEGS